MNKLYIAFLVVPMLISCASIYTPPPKEIDKIVLDTKIEHDNFREQTWVRTKIYRSVLPFGIPKDGASDVTMRYRASYVSGSLEFIQLYISRINPFGSWVFFNSATGEDQYDFKFTKLDSEVDSSSGIVTTTEHFSLTIPKKQLKKMSTSDYKIKIYGKRGTHHFSVPARLTQAFLMKLECFETGTCK